MVTIRKILIKETLTDLTSNIAKIESSVSKKIACSMTTLVNENIDKKQKIDPAVLKQLLTSFESRLRECEIIYYSYLRDPDHAILSGSSAGLPLDYNIVLSYASCALEKIFR